MVETKPTYSPKGNESKKSTDKHKGKAPKTKRYRGNKTRTKTQDPEIEDKTNFKGQCTDLEGYIFNLSPRDLDKFSRIMKELEGYLGAT